MGRVLHGVPTIHSLPPLSFLFLFFLSFFFSKVGFKFAMELRENDLEHFLKYFRFSNLTLCVSVFCLRVGMYTMCVPGTCQSQKRTDLSRTRVTGG